LTNFSYLIILWFGAGQVIEQKITIGVLVAFQMLASKVTDPLLRLVQLWQEFQQVLLSVDRLGDILNTAPEAEPGSGVVLPHLHGKVSFEKVFSRYQSDQEEPVLKGISLTVQPGMFVGIVGRSGSGKSTLSKHPLQQTHRKSFSSGVKLLSQGKREQQPKPKRRSVQPSKAFQAFRQGERDFTNNRSNNAQQPKPKRRSVQPSKAFQAFRQGERDSINNPRNNAQQPKRRSIQLSKAFQAFRQGERDSINNPTKAIAPVVQQPANNRRLLPSSASELPKPKPEKSWWDKAGDFVNNHASDFDHAALDVVGFVPVVGDAADLVNAGWYAVEGDWTNAALSAASAIPIVGDLAKVGKYGARVAQYTARVENASPTIRRVTNGGSATFDAANGARYAYEGDWTNAALSFASAGVGGAVTARSLGRNRVPNNANVSGDTTAGGRRLEIEGRPLSRPAIEARPRRLAIEAGPRRLAIEAGPRRPAIEAGPRRLAIEAGPRRPLAERGARLAPGQRAMTREQWTELDSERRAAQNVQNIPGHGNDKHGSKTTLRQQRVRVETGLAANGHQDRNQVNRSTRFDNARLQREAVARALRQVERKPTFVVNGSGQARERRGYETIVVDGPPSGYGRGFERKHGVVRPTRQQDRYAKVVSKYNRPEGKWEPVTQYPINKPPVVRPRLPRIELERNLRVVSYLLFN
jgi:ABC-type oligopeptide transport system ATPase subunit